ncbi:hypothetical protein DFJ43DRAFT_1101615 [Lentinula guzmanii]|uniref:Uncharacterized protein n=4 Tax=Lentinula TaxID=5352 RepID=A0AA38JGB7_9AGAR|nr:hypothetical protein DFJ43DRAFT_1101615 [Lentinula guzmanii]KAJ3740799.1 hypothetical protein DFH05DRAFT_1507110 [Lentinula detonsa]KAJ3788872.1 hypothetical protein GGU10DRAFT_344817 [Lentinula aff. detonsa]KAJ3794342.1 hypothetical protein GGU11DRAFT_322354 [Lentinula aff. detonsa]
MSEEILPGDVVAVTHGLAGRQEGLVVGSHIDYLGRQILEVQLDSYEVFHAWQPTVTRIRRTVYNRPAQVPLIGSVPRTRTVERKIYW